MLVLYCLLFLYCRCRSSHKERIQISLIGLPPQHCSAFPKPGPGLLSRNVRGFLYSILWGKDNLIFKNKCLYFYLVFLIIWSINCASGCIFFNLKYMFAPTTTNIIAYLIKYEWNMERLHISTNKVIHNVHNTTHDTCWLLPFLYSTSWRNSVCFIT
jgi:hypothetical protein